MKKYVVVSLLTMIAGSLVACGNQFNSQIRDSVRVNKEAKSMVEYETSPSNPEALFKQWNEQAAKDPASKQKVQESVCRELKALDGQSLSVFENEVENDANKEVLANCRQDLKDQSDRYYAAERSQMAVKINAKKLQGSSNNFQFPVNVQKRDMSNGYFAVSGDVAKKEVVLTFDDGPNEIYTKSILQSLKEVNAKVMFFQLGKAVRLNPSITKMVAADGHIVGSHTVTHTCIGNLKECGHANGGRQIPFDQAVAEIRGGHQAVFDVLGWVDPVFRFPYGAATPELKNYLKANSVGEFFWAIDSEDWKAQSNENLINSTLAQLEARGRGIILFHDIQRKTAEILPQFLRELYSRGYSIVQLIPADPNARYNSKLVKKTLP